MPGSFTPPALNKIIHHIRDDVTVCANTIHRRIYNNPHHTSAAILAALGVHASQVIDHISSLDTLANNLGLSVGSHSSGEVELFGSADSSGA
jgi:hypothetical protein